MQQQDTMQVCLNGHRITDRYNSSPVTRKNFCIQCGEKTIINCPTCGKNIKGKFFYGNIADTIADKTQVPDICEYCGKDFPWREKKKMIKQASLKDNEKDNLFLLKTICDRFHLIVKQISQ